MEFTEMELLIIRNILDRVTELEILEQMFIEDDLDFNIKDEVEGLKSKLSEMGID